MTPPKEPGARVPNEEAAWRELRKAHPMRATRFRKRPVEIEAMQFGGSLGSYLDICDWMGEAKKGTRYDDPHMVIPTLEGDHRANPGDWIIKGVAGEFYPCKPDIFERTYEPAAHRAALQGDARLWDFLTERVHRGEGTVVLGLTEAGDVGVWLHGDCYHDCIAAGDDAEDAVRRALARIAERLRLEGRGTSKEGDSTPQGESASNGPGHPVDRLSAPSVQSSEERDAKDALVRAALAESEHEDRDQAPCGLSPATSGRYAGWLKEHCSVGARLAAERRSAARVLCDLMSKRCPTCLGLGWTDYESDTNTYAKCADCDGRGER